MNRHIHIYNGDWYFWDETEANRYGPYETREIAKRKFIRYLDYLSWEEPKKTEEAK